MITPLELRKRIFKNSSYFEISNSTSISSNETYVFVLEDKFIPYDDVLIINLNSDNDCTAKINFNQAIPVPRGNKAQINIPVESISLTNDGDTTISANEIKIYYKATGSQGKDLSNKISKGINVAGSLSLIKGFFK